MIYSLEMTSERVLIIVLVLLIMGAATYFTISKFTSELVAVPSASPTPGSLNFYLTQAPKPSAQVQINSTSQPVNNVSGVQTGLINPPQPSELPLVRNKKLNKFPGILGEEQLKDKAVTLVTSKGNIIIQVYPDVPKATSNFLLLASNGFYDNLTFHRVEPGLLIQGGDPKGDGTGDGGYTFEDELNEREYKKGTLAMANRGPNTNSTQFFIVIADNPGIPKKYTIFGSVIFGLDVVERIAPQDVIYKAVVQPLK